MWLNIPDKKLGFIDSSQVAQTFPTGGGASITISDTAPASPTVGSLWWDSVGGQLYLWYSDANGNQWVIANNTSEPPAPGTVSIGDTPPASPVVGSLWWDSTGCQLYLWDDDGTSRQWVPASNIPTLPEAPNDGTAYARRSLSWSHLTHADITDWAATITGALAPYLLLAGGTLTGALSGTTAAFTGVLQAAAATFTGLLTPSGGIAGFADGSSAAPGCVGEVISNVRLSTAAVTISSGVVINIASILLTPGDWDIYATAWVTVGAGGMTAARFGTSSTSATLPPDAIITGSVFNINAGASLAGASTTYAVPLGVACASVASATTYYLAADCSFPSGTCTAFGNIWARRAR